jgi:hypothetical protein
MTSMNPPTLNGRFRQQANLCQSFDSDVCDWRSLGTIPLHQVRNGELAGAGPSQDMPECDR